MNETHWFKSPFLAEDLKPHRKCSQNTCGMFKIYSCTPSTTNPLSRPLQRGFPMSLPYVSLKRPPRYPDRGHSPAVTNC